jgi:hypothetical protein
LLAECGVIIGLLNIFLMFFVLYKTIKKTIAIRRDSDADMNEHLCALYFSILVQIFTLTYGMTGNPLYDTEYVSIYLIAVTCAVSSMKERTKGENGYENCKNYHENVKELRSSSAGLRHEKNA